VNATALEVRGTASAADAAMQHRNPAVVDRRSSIADAVRRGFRAYEAADRAEIEALLADDFTFTSPYDDHIDRATYFERCWPSAGTFEPYELQQVTVDGDSCFVVYAGKRKHGSRFHNTERWQFDGDQIKVKAVEVFFGLPPYAQPELPPEVAIRQLLEVREQAIRDKDAATVVGLYAEDAVSFNLAPPLRVEGAQLRDPKRLEGWFAGWKGSIQTELRELQIVARGELGFATALHRLVATAVDGNHVDMWMRVTYCFRQDNGAWKIASVHESVPFAMDGSYRALVDLKPSPEI
jgi:ketosteroid isomerase-like protein